MSSFKEIPFPQIRHDLKDFLDLTNGKNYVHALSEIDITQITEIFNVRKKLKIRNNSLTAYVIWCYGQAIKKHPEVQAMRKGKNLIIFDDVDVAIMIERDLPNGKKIPFPYIFRGVQNKTYADLEAELQAVKKMELAELIKKKKSLIIRSFPKFLRMFVLRKLLRNPFKTKEVLGTVGLTTLGMFISNRRFWPVPMGPYPCIIATGGTYTKTEGDIVKKMMCATICVDHDLTDGAPVARFGKTFMTLMETGEGIL